MTRRVDFDLHVPAEGYSETVHGPGDARLLHVGGEAALPAEVSLEDGAESRHVLLGGSPRTVEEARRLRGAAAAPYGRLALMNRYQCELARLSVRGLGARAATAFASATDLGTGLEAALPIEIVGDDEVRVTVTDCSPRSLLRIYWLLEEEASARRGARARELQDSPERRASTGCRRRRSPRSVTIRPSSSSARDGSSSRPAQDASASFGIPKTSAIASSW